MTTRNQTLLNDIDELHAIHIRLSTLARKYKQSRYESMNAELYLEGATTKIRTAHERLRIHSLTGSKP